jgi:hypothetical protein
VRLGRPLHPRPPRRLSACRPAASSPSLRLGLCPPAGPLPSGWASARAHAAPSLPLPTQARHDATVPHADAAQQRDQQLDAALGELQQLWDSLGEDLEPYGDLERLVHGVVHHAVHPHAIDGARLAALQAGAQAAGRCGGLPLQPCSRRCRLPGPGLRGGRVGGALQAGRQARLLTRGTGCCARRGGHKALQGPLFVSPSKYLGAGGQGGGSSAAGEQPVELFALLEAWTAKQQASAPQIAALGSSQLGGSSLIATPATSSHAPHALVGARARLVPAQCGRAAACVHGPPRAWRGACLLMCLAGLCSQAQLNNQRAAAKQLQQLQLSVLERRRLVGAHLCEQQRH